MKHLFSIAIAVAVATITLSPVGAAPVTYELDPAHTHVGFQIRHLVSKVSGQFDRFSGTLVYDPDSPKTSKVEATAR